MDTYNKSTKSARNEAVRLPRIFHHALWIVGCTILTMGGGMAQTSSSQSTVREATPQAMQTPSSAQNVVNESESKRSALLRPLSDFYAIQGTWSRTGNGRPAKSSNSSPLSVRFDGLRMMFADSGKTTQFEYVVNSLATHRHIDLYASELDAEPTMRGIYQINGDELVLCLAGTGADRPTSLTENNDTVQRFRFRRQSQQNPHTVRNANERLNLVLTKISGDNGRIDLLSAANLLVESANAGDPRGELWLATYLHRGNEFFVEAPEVAQQIAHKALAPVQQAATAGDHFSQLVLGRAYELGLGLEADPKQATRWYKSSWSQGNSEAMYHLGRTYGKAHYGKARRERYRKAVRAGHVPSELKIAIHIFEGNDCKQEPRRAINDFRKLIEKGSVEAMARMGIGLSLYGKPQEKSAAILWSRRAAEAGSVDGMWHLGNLALEKRFGTEQDGLRWLARAAERGSENARNDLVRMNIPGSEKYRNSSNYEDPSIAASRARLNALVSQYRNSQGRMPRISNQLPPDPQADERRRYEAYKMRQLKVDLQQRLNNEVVPGLQRFNYGKGYGR